MKISFFGGASEIGRSCIEVEEHGRSLFLDCGVKLGKKDEYPMLGAHDIRRMRRTVLSHAHLDHVGFLPFAYARGCAAKSFATKPTRDLLQLLLADYAKISRKFGQREMLKALRACSICEYGDVVQGPPDFSLHNAGHILGSAMVRIGRKLLYTSDISWRGTNLLDPAEKGLGAENMIIESTYGARADKLPPLKEAERTLCRSVNRTLRAGGKVLIPTFAVGRGQEILLILDNYMRSGAIAQAPIFVDGMVNKANRIYRHNVIYAKREIQLRILMSEDDPFKSKFFTVPLSKDKREVFESDAAIIVSTSGMLSGGPALHYLKRLAGNSSNKLLFIGYQAEGTRGRELVDGAKEIEIDGERIGVKLQVEQIPFSAHSDHLHLLEFAKNTRNLKRVFVIHGEAQKTSELAEALEDTGLDVTVPANLESYSI